MSDDHAAFLREWAADIRRNSGKSVDADRLDQIADILSPPVSGGQTPPPQAHVELLDRLEEIAKGQKAYHDQKQQEFPSPEDYLNEDGELKLPADIGPLLSQSSYNGRFSEADWWLSTIQKMKTEAGASPSQHLMGRWLPIEQADRTITNVEDFSEVGVILRTSDRYWVRDEDGRVYEAAWSEGKNGERDYWWDFEGESPVDPVEFMPHPLDPRFATSEGRDNG